MALSQCRSVHLEQPFLCCTGSLENPTNYWIIIDKEVIFCGSNFLNAFLNLYSCFHVFNVNWPKYLSMFYDFFSEYVFKIKKTLSPAITGYIATLENISRETANL